MKISFARKLTAFKTCALDCSQAGEMKKMALIKEISKTSLVCNKSLIDYHDLLLFQLAYPGSKALIHLVESELKRMTLFLKKQKDSALSLLSDSGLPYTGVCTHFSHDLCTRLLADKTMEVKLESMEDGQFSLNEVLKHTLPAVERDKTTAGMDDAELLQTLGVPEQKRLQFLVHELSRFDDQPLLKDMLFDGLNMFVSICGKGSRFSRTYNRFLLREAYCSYDLLKKFDHIQLLNSPIGEPVELTHAHKQQLSDVIRHSLTLTARETDPATYLCESALYFYELERGISIALYGMSPERQLPLESYVGFTLFRNGLPMAYGGAWVFGRAALFGINIFESYRGGESGYVLCQLLRVYRQAFGVDYFEAEPYQYGGDNPDGIKSGAFWFYYRYGFRPLDPTLLKLAKSEEVKIKSKADYRSSYKTLERFTESNIGFQVSGTKAIRLASVNSLITKMIQKKYGSDRLLAERESVQRLLDLLKIGRSLTAAEKRVLPEIALMAEAMQWEGERERKILYEMVHAKPYDLMRYQELLCQLLA